MRQWCNPLDVFEVKQPYGALDGNYIDGVREGHYGRPVGFSVQELQKPGEYGAIPFPGNCEPRHAPCLPPTQGAACVAHLVP